LNDILRFSLFMIFLSRVHMRTHTQREIGTLMYCVKTAKPIAAKLVLRL